MAMLIRLHFDQNSIQVNFSIISTILPSWLNRNHQCLLRIQLRGFLRVVWSHFVDMLLSNVQTDIFNLLGNSHKVLFAFFIKYIDIFLLFFQKCLFGLFLFNDFLHVYFGFLILRFKALDMISVPLENRPYTLGFEHKARNRAIWWKAIFAFIYELEQFISLVFVKW